MSDNLYCVTCSWTGQQSPPPVHFASNKNELGVLLSYLKASRSPTQNIPYDIQVFKKQRNIDHMNLREEIEEILEYRIGDEWDTQGVADELLTLFCENFELMCVDDGDE